MAVLGLLASMAVAAPAQAAFQPPFQTNFEIDGNTVVNGSPPGAGVDWDNASQFVKGYTNNTTEPCTGQNDDTLGSNNLNNLDVLAPVIDQNANVNGKVDLCNAYAAWEAVTVGTQIHYVLYAAWRRNPSETGEASFFVPLIPATATSNADVRLLQFDYNSNTGTTTAFLRRFTAGSGWNKTALVNGFESAVAPVSPADFGELAVDLTLTGIIPADAPCARFVAAYVFTQTGNSDSALLKDYVAFQPAMQVDTCSTVQVTKVTSPATPSPAASFDASLKQSDSATVYPAHMTVPGSPTATLTQVPASPDYGLTEVAPAPWSLRSIVCNTFALVPGAPLATPVTITLVTNGVPTGQVLPVVPPAYLPGGSGPAAQCTITDEAPSLTLVKAVNNDARPSPPATPDMWTLQATGPQSVSVPGSSTGVTTIVAPGTYNLSEIHTPGNPPPVSYDDGTTWNCDGTTTTSIVVTATTNATCTITNTATPAALTLIKTVDSTGDPGTPPAATDFTLSASFQSGAVGDTGALDGNGAITGVVGAATVTNRQVKRGVYNLAETTVPGYQASWRCVDAAGTVLATAPQVSIPTTDVGNRAAVLQSITVTCTVTNTYRVATISISGPAVNAVGEAHVFTVTVLQAGGTQPVVGIVPVLSFVPEGNFTEGRDYTVTNGCAAGTNAAGQCTVTVQATGPGVIAIQGVGLPAPFNVTFDPPPASQKRFRAYQVTGSASGINFAGQDHTFTLSGVQFVATDANGAPTGQGPLDSGSIIRFSWAGPGTATGPTVTSLGGQQYQCVVDVTGTCAVTVTSAAAATGTLTVTGIWSSSTGAPGRRPSRASTTPHPRSSARRRC
jgi:hypothetical protein